MSMDGLDGKVAIVAGGGEPLGRSIALGLAARGARVVVVGEHERALGETVGEVAFGGGKARHVVADLGREADREAVVARAVDVFGGLDLVVAGEAALAALACHVRDGGRLVALGPAAPGAELAARVRTVAVEVARRAVTCNALGIAADVDPDAAAQLVVFLCSRAAQPITGHALALA